jgi:hypothetical protein
MKMQSWVVQVPNRPAASIAFNRHKVGNFKSGARRFAFEELRKLDRIVGLVLFTDCVAHVQKPRSNRTQSQAQPPRESNRKRAKAPRRG